MIECTGVGLRQLLGKEVLDNPLEFILLKHEIFSKYATVLTGPNFLHALPPLIFFTTALTIIYKLMQFRGMQLSTYLKLSWLPVLAAAFWITSVLNFTMGICYHESLYCFVQKSHKQMIGSHDSKPDEGYMQFFWKKSTPESTPPSSLATPESAALSFSILISLFELMIAQSQLLPWFFGKTTSLVEKVCHIGMFVFSTSFQKLTFARQNIKALFIDGICTTTKKLLQKRERNNNEQYTESHSQEKMLGKREWVNDDQYTDSDTTEKLHGKRELIGNEQYSESSTAKKLLEKREWINNELKAGGITTQKLHKREEWQNNEQYNEILAGSDAQMSNGVTILDDGSEFESSSSKNLTHDRK